jgi:cytidylate kinase
MMSIVTISRGSYSRGKEVAEKLAQKLGYRCFSRDILLKASEQFNIPEIKLIRAIHDAPSILDRFTFGKERYVAYIRSALLEQVQKDNVVYHGLAGHFFLQGIPHVLKVRITADFEDRVQEEMRRESITEKEAGEILRKDDNERRKWSIQLYGIDTWDANLYDIILHLKTLKVDDAVDIIQHVVSLPGFQTTPQSQKILDDLVLAARVKVALSEDFPTATVSAQDGEVFVGVKYPQFEKTEVAERIQFLARKAVGYDIKVNFTLSP